MAALEVLKTALDLPGSRRLWTALGRSADDASFDHNSPPSHEARTFRLLDSGTQDLLNREEAAGAPVSMSADDGTFRAVVKPFAGWVAAIVAAAASMTLLFPPDEARAYQYYENLRHFDHAQKELIRMVPTYALIANRPGTWKTYKGSASAWSGSSDVKITPDPGGNAVSIMALSATYVDVPGANYAGWAKMSAVDSRGHWTGKPAGTVALNVGVTDAQHNYVDRKRLPYAVISHELGHALGLDHTGIRGCNGSYWNQGIMQDSTNQIYYNCGYVFPQDDDTQGVNALYSSSK